LLKQLRAQYKGIKKTGRKPGFLIFIDRFCNFLIFQAKTDQRLLKFMKKDQKWVKFVSQTLITRNQETQPVSDNTDQAKTEEAQVKNGSCVKPKEQAVKPRSPKRGSRSLKTNKLLTLIKDLNEDSYLEEISKKKKIDGPENNMFGGASEGEDEEKQKICLKMFGNHENSATFPIQNTSSEPPIFYNIDQTGLKVKEKESEGNTTPYNFKKSSFSNTFKWKSTENQEAPLSSEVNPKFLPPYLFLSC
jgi:hypothetical protein